MSVTAAQVDLRTVVLAESPIRAGSRMAVVSAEPKPSYEELLAENAVLKEALVRVEAALAQAMARIAELEARLNQNSTNSSKPPSSDPPFAKPKSLRGKSPGPIP